MGNVEAADIAQLDSFEVLPAPLARVELRSIGREALQLQTLGGAIGEEVPDDLTAMDWGAIPDEHHPAWHLAQQVLEKPNDVVRVDRAVLAMEVELALGRNGTDGREMVAGAPLPQDGRVAPRGIGPDDAGERIKAGFVYEEETLPLGLRPPLRAGQVSSRQRAMAASSRWRARRAGCCGLQRMPLHKRPT